MSITHPCTEFTFKVVMLVRNRQLEKIVVAMASEKQLLQKKQVIVPKRVAKFQGKTIKSTLKT